MLPEATGTTGTTGPRRDMGSQGATEATGGYHLRYKSFKMKTKNLNIVVVAFFNI